jgi:hypothetical protein
MLALRTLRIFAAKIFSLFCEPIADRFPLCNDFSTCTTSGLLTCLRTATVLPFLNLFVVRVRADATYFQGDAPQTDGMMKIEGEALHIAG